MSILRKINPRYKFLFVVICGIALLFWGIYYMTEANIHSVYETPSECSQPPPFTDVSISGGSADRVRLAAIDKEGRVWVKLGRHCWRQI